MQMVTARFDARHVRGVLAVTWFGLVACNSSFGSYVPDTPDANADSGSAARDSGPAAGDAGVRDASDTDAGNGDALFSQPNPWNLRVDALPVATRSNAILGTLATLGGWGLGHLQVDFSLAVLSADPTTPRVAVSAGTGYDTAAGDAVPAVVPLPKDGNAEGSAGYACDTANFDCHVLVVSRAEGKLFELYNATATDGGMQALSLVTWDLNRAYGPALRGSQCPSADASGLPMAALLPTSTEVAHGEVAHAIRLLLPPTRLKQGVFVAPATHAGNASSTQLDAPAYGTRLRLKSTFDDSGFSAGAKVILRAMRLYGVVVANQGNVALTFADDRLRAQKWADLSVFSHTFSGVNVDDFEVVDLGPEVTAAGDGVRVI